MSQSRMLELAHERLYWPEPSQIWKPSGSGPKIFAHLASEKIGEKIKREFPNDAKGLEVSVLAANPEGDETEAPIAIICQFSSPVSHAVIKEVHRLAWSFSRTRSLITIEPQLLRVWSCCEPPQEDKNPESVYEATEIQLVEQAADELQWVELVSGQFFQARENRFKRNGSADQMLLKNLKDVRQQLQFTGLDSDEIIHDLLARIIFIQFLFQKQDSKGTPALNKRIIKKLHRQKILSKKYNDLPEILESFDDTYNLFRWLNNKFNGDLFPDKGQKEEDSEAEWQAEMTKVHTEDNRYLVILAQFARGDTDMQSGQMSLWPYYSFDVIPLEFISSIYEEFVNKKVGKGVHYTPEYVVDFILDGVLPWNDYEWNLKILDPACGSGIFLVKAFQRLIYRWEISHTFQRIPVHVLRTLLENNIFGVDIDKEAVRVASFSLYLTMLDNVEPLDYWENEVRFPRLRGKQLIHADFFTENIEGLRTKSDGEIYDLIIGNAPWGESSTTHKAKNWANDNGWIVADNNIGTLFLAKAIPLLKETGIISLIQPASSLLSNQLRPAKQFRDKLFEEAKVEEVVNLSALRFKIFPDATSPPCIVSISRSTSKAEPFTYICPKPNQSQDDDYKIIIDPQDINLVYPHELNQNSSIWSTLMWGSRRDLALLSKLENFPSLAKLEKQGIVKTRQGIIRGTKRKKIAEIRNRKILDESSSSLLEDSFLFLNASDLPINLNDEVHCNDSTDFSAFNNPQMIIKMSWQKKRNRFLSVLVKSDEADSGIICSGSYITVHVDYENLSLMEAACLSYNSKLAVYYLLLSSHRFASYRPEIKSSELLRVPISDSENFSLQGIQNLDDIDKYICKAFSLRESEWILINDLFNYTLPDFKGGHNSPGRQKTHRLSHILPVNGEEPELREYCECFIRVIKAGFGSDKEICVSIFQEPSKNYLPVRLVAIYLNKSIHSGVKVETIDSQALLDRLHKLNDLFMQQSASGTGGIYYQRVARVYTSSKMYGEQIPTVYLIKPDKVRYWTRSMALRDADEVSADIMAGHLYPNTNLESVPLS